MTGVLSLEATNDTFHGIHCTVEALTEAAGVFMGGLKEKEVSFRYHNTYIVCVYLHLER